MANLGAWLVLQIVSRERLSFSLGVSSASPSESPEAIARAVRFALAALVLGVSYPNIHCAFAMGRFEQIFMDMLGNKPLPAATVFVLRYRWLFEGSSVLFPMLSVMGVFSSRSVRPTYLSGVTVLLVFGQLFFMWFALTGPVVEIVRGMQGGAQ